VKLNRLVFVLFGAFILGFFLWIALMMFLSASGINIMTSNSLGRDFVGIYSIVGFPVCYVIGAVLGDWIGKKVGYYLPKLS
jgi:hypothetical protein